MAPPSKKTDSEKMMAYLSCLDLVPTKKAKTIDPGQQRHQLILDKLIPVPAVQNGGRRFKKNRPPRPKPKRISSFFKTHPIPFTSGLGLQLIRHSETGSCTCSTNIDQSCSTSDRIPHLNTQNWSVTTLKKKGIQEQNWVHPYAFTRKEKIIRNSEIVIGLNIKSWSLLNKCKPCSVQIPKSDVLPSGLKLTTITRGIFRGSFQLITLDEDDEPQESLDRRTFENETPVIKIENIFKVEKYAKYFRKTNY